VDRLSHRRGPVVALRFHEDARVPERVAERRLRGKRERHLGRIDVVIGAVLDDNPDVLEALSARGPFEGVLDGAGELRGNRRRGAIHENEA
jgi:hypothetical protein